MRAFGKNVTTTVSVEATPIDAVSSELGVIQGGRRERLTTAWQQQSEWGVHYALLESSIYIYIHREREREREKDKWSLRKGIVDALAEKA